MEILIQAKKSAADPRIKAYAQAKLEKLARHFDQILEARMELGTEKNKSLENMKVAQLIVHVNGTVLKAIQSASHANEAIDLVVDKMDRQIREHKEKIQDHRPAKRLPVPATRSRRARLNGVSRIKRIKLQPISEEQARQEMEALGHAFFVFLNEESHEVNVLHRQADGSLGLVEADLG